MVLKALKRGMGVFIYFGDSSSHFCLLCHLPLGKGDTWGSLLRCLSVCPSVCLCPSRHIFFLIFYNSCSIEAIEMKLIFKNMIRESAMHKSRNSNFTILGVIALSYSYRAGDTCSEEHFFFVNGYFYVHVFASNSIIILLLVSFLWH